jgi:hypothetical protein
MPACLLYMQYVNFDYANEELNSPLSPQTTVEKS